MGKSVTLLESDFEQVGNNKQAILYVEVRTASVAMRDVDIKMSYGGAEEHVRATGIWAVKTKFRGNGTADSLVEPFKNAHITVEKYYLLYKQAAGATLINGIQSQAHELDIDANTSIRRIGNPVEFEFQLLPAGIGFVSRVKFDMSRSVEGRAYSGTYANPKLEGVTLNLPANRDAANDDLDRAISPDEVRNGDKFYSIDAPNIKRPLITQPNGSKLPDHTQGFHRMNALEFIRVMFGEDVAFQGGNAVQGSRASELYAWHSWLKFDSNASGAWVRVDPEANKLGIKLCANSKRPIRHAVALNPRSSSCTEATMLPVVATTITLMHLQLLPPIPAVSWQSLPTRSACDLICNVAPRLLCVTIERLAIIQLQVVDDEFISNDVRPAYMEKPRAGDAWDRYQHALEALVRLKSDTGLSYITPRILHHYRYVNWDPFQGVGILYARPTSAALIAYGRQAVPAVIADFVRRADRPGREVSDADRELAGVLEESWQVQYALDRAMAELQKLPRSDVRSIRGYKSFIRYFLRNDFFNQVHSEFRDNFPPPWWNDYPEK
jgi:hypothetical protein